MLERSRGGGKPVSKSVLRPIFKSELHLNCLMSGVAVLQRIYLVSSGFDLSFELPSLPIRPRPPVAGDSQEATDTDLDESYSNTLSLSTSNLSRSPSPELIIKSPTSALFGSVTRKMSAVASAHNNYGLGSKASAEAQLTPTQAPPPGFHPPLLLPEARQPRRV